MLDKAVVILARFASCLRSRRISRHRIRGRLARAVRKGQNPQGGDLDVDKLDAAFEYAKETSQHGGILVVRNGWLVYERYFGRGDREATPELASCGKAFTSIAVGIGIHEKQSLIPNGLAEKVFTPKYMPESIFPLGGPSKAEITLGQFLAMSAGIRGTNPGYVHGQKVTLDPPAVDGPIATTDPWPSISRYGALPARVGPTRRRRRIWRPSFCAGLREWKCSSTCRRIGKPLGWGRWGYALNRPGLKIGPHAGGGSIAMRSTDVLRFAYLLLREGKWGKQQIVPAEYVDTATTEYVQPALSVQSGV